MPEPLHHEVLQLVLEALPNDVLGITQVAQHDVPSRAQGGVALLLSGWPRINVSWQFP